MNIADLENRIINADCMDILKQLPDKCVDLVLTDPPYLYTNCEFDKNGFNEELFFKECYRVLKDNSFIVFTGYGESFYRWNQICFSVGFNFKEQGIWNKINISTPFTELPRSFENISILQKGKKKFNEIFIDSIEDAIISESFIQLTQTCKRINSLLNTNLDLARKFIESGIIEMDKEKHQKFNVCIGKNAKSADRGVMSLKRLTKGKKQTNIFTVSKDSVYDNIHPTQKPIELMERLLKICSKENDLVLDCFSGSGTTAIACHRLNRRFICIEKDKDYYEASVKRLENELKQLTLF
jgi:DNA modification methylase